MRYCAANLQKMYRYERELKAELEQLRSDSTEEDVALSSSKAVIRTIFRDGKSNISGDEFYGMQQKISAQLKQGIPPKVIVPPVLSVAEKKAKADDIDLRARAFAQEFAKFREKKEAARKEAKRKADKEKAYNGMGKIMTDAELDAFEKEVQEADAILYARIKAENGEMDTMTDAELDAFEKEVQEGDAILYAKIKADEEKAYNDMGEIMTDAELDAFEKEVQEADAILYAKIKADKEKAEKEKIALKKKNRFASLKNFFRSEKKTASREDKGMKAG